MIKIKKGLDLPLAGVPASQLEAAPAPRSVALLGPDYVGLRPTMRVQEGDTVRLGQVLFEDKKNPGVLYTAPASGTVQAIHRGPQRFFESLVIDVAPQGAEHNAIRFPSFGLDALTRLPREEVVKNLVDSGLWTALRTRPYSKVPALDAQPAAIFVNVMDTHPLGFDPQPVLDEGADAFAAGLDALARLAPTVFVCHAPGTRLPASQSQQVRTQAFDGPHPAGLSGTHIHHLMPASRHRQVWSVHYQDVIAIGRLFTTGALDLSRVVALAGPSVQRPRLLRTRVGASLDQLTQGELLSGIHRTVSGSVLSGRKAADHLAYLGRYHLHVSVLPEGHEREFMGWMSPGADRFSVMRIYLSQFMAGKRFAMNTSTNGSPRAMVPIGAYEKVMPLDILPTQLLRALIVGDLEVAEQLGALELDEEDLALCTYVCPGKYEYGDILRDNLTRIEKEG
ncbi:MAG: Na(+)-translocating NADH-quinone reductase subunit A [Hydrogenophaga sp.]|uniref:Na(+)-translocating NADH-quinone reductase subunit A n=1 Tax=Hydrogenophaga sp. TaxID=1904254 RepID=UPI00275194F2|nr:Na(+)-translocating NADH-quinone reductase subunit A [Hydrogenophaga sp.]MDP2418622.1 Na(+)-translocating NADH-quinone reductase subunit A [Hydrogenophaga sp.]MDZ4188078.1 Na(+)-translocating NADH-quinone reductase subunit A [Hydrogenophaga sp.]